MRFKNSGMENEYSMEDRYNNFWNSEVVSAYNLLKIHAQVQSNSFFSTNNPSVDSLVKKYCDGVTTIVHNLTRQIDLFEDQEDAKSYLQSTKQVAIADLEEVMSTFLLSGGSMNYITNTLVLLQGKKAESTQEVSSEENLDLGMVTDNIDSVISGQTFNELFSGGYEPRYPS
jgi:hypothetical protein